MKKGKIIIVGATGVIGNAALERFVSSGWDVISVSRRKPECKSGSFKHISIDLTKKNECNKIFSSMNDITHVLYTALFEKPGLILGWYEEDQMQTNLEMMQNIMEPISASNPGLKHVSFLQGTKAYGVHHHSISIPAKESGSRDDHENFYWFQEDYIKSLQKDSNWTWTIFRPQIVFGYSYGTAMNLIPIIGIYAAICYETKKPFSFPGRSDVILEAVDARLIAKACEWAAFNKESENQIFNITNGDVFTWGDVWSTISQSLNISPGPDDQIQLSAWLPKQSKIWESIVDKYDLKKNKLSEMLGESHYYADFCFGHGVAENIKAALVSTIKLRQAGFHECIDTEEMFKELFNEFQERKILPKFN